MIFSLQFPMGWTIIFFGFFQKKLSLCTMGKIHFFWKIDFQWGGWSFFWFFQKNLSLYTMGKIHFFWEWNFQWGEGPFFWRFFREEVVDIYNRVFMSTGFLMGWFMVLWTSNYIFYWCPRWYFRLKKNTFLDIGWFCLFLYLNVIWVIKNGLLKNDV